MPLRRHTYKVARDLGSDSGHDRDTTGTRRATQSPGHHFADQSALAFCLFGLFRFVGFRFFCNDGVIVQLKAHAVEFGAERGDF